jgi:hypothetical protein
MQKLVTDSNVSYAMQQRTGSHSNAIRYSTVTQQFLTVKWRVNNHTSYLVNKVKSYKTRE